MLGDFLAIFCFGDDKQGWKQLERISVFQQRRWYPLTSDAHKERGLNTRISRQLATSWWGQYMGHFCTSKGP